MSSLCITVVFLLLVIFLIILLSALFKKEERKLTTNISEDSNYVENQLRALLKKYPKSDIYIANVTRDKESMEIIKKLCKDYPQIHIKE